MTHLFRPQDPPIRSSPPVGTRGLDLWTKKAGYFLNWVAGLTRSHHFRRYLAYLVVVVGLVCQMVLLLVASYLVDLSMSLMELWAALARKHLEITL